MATKISNFTTGTLDDVTIAGIPFLPTEIEFWVTDKSVGSPVLGTLSYGTADGTNQFADSFVDGSTGKSYSNECIHVRDNSGGVLTNILVASLTSFDNLGGGDFGFTLHFNNKASGWRIRFKARG